VPRRAVPVQRRIRDLACAPRSISPAIHFGLGGASETKLRIRTLRKCSAWQSASTLRSRCHLPRHDPFSFDAARGLQGRAPCKTQSIFALEMSRAASSRAGRHLDRANLLATPLALDRALMRRSSLSPLGEGRGSSRGARVIDSARPRILRAFAREFDSSPLQTRTEI
jgi:hypothetical protein